MKKKKKKFASWAEGKNRWRHTGVNAGKRERGTFMSWDVRHRRRFVALMPRVETQIHCLISTSSGPVSGVSPGLSTRYQCIYRRALYRCKGLRNAATLFFRGGVCVRVGHIRHGIHSDATDTRAHERHARFSVWE